MKWDVVVVGSGFGGAVTACRLAEAGARVLVLERGRRWTPDSYPSVTSRNWLWDEDEPERQNGWLDLRVFGDMSVAMGAGVGGGSLIYANVSIEAPASAFRAGWPEAISYPVLKPHYRTVGDMLEVMTLPENQWTPRTHLMKEAATALGHRDRFMLVPQAVRFCPDGVPDGGPAPDYPRLPREPNRWGRLQGTCVHCGNCDLGCPVQAKNTLDLNYLARAEALGAEIRPLQHVRCISPDGSGYRLHVRDLAGAGEDRIRADKVVVAAGSIGSTELLLRCRDQYRTLPRLSRQLGHGWTSNGDFLTPAWYPERTVDAARGPTISAAINYLDGSDAGQRYLVEDGGFPDLLANFLRRAGRDRRVRRHRLARLLAGLDQAGPLSGLMPWFGQAEDQAGGVLSLGRRWTRPWRRDRLKLVWDYRAAEAAVEALAARHKALSEATGGKASVPATWRWLRNLVTPHPLGGCNMADDPRHGVVDHHGQVFGYPNLYVMDGAVVPVALGLNPSRTIAALAEFAAPAIAS